MKRIYCTILVCFLILTVSTLAVGKGNGKRTQYTFESHNHLLGPVDAALAHDGTLLVKHLQVGSFDMEFMRTLNNGEEQTGTLKIKGDRTVQVCTEPLIPLNVSYTYGR